MSIYRVDEVGDFGPEPETKYHSFDAARLAMTRIANKRARAVGGEVIYSGEAKVQVTIGERVVAYLRVIRQVAR